MDGMRLSWPKNSVNLVRIPLIPSKNPSAYLYFANFWRYFGTHQSLMSKQGRGANIFTL